MRAFKYVDVEHADAVAQGILRIGTLQSYATLEGARRDEAEGAMVRESGDYYLRDSNDSTAGTAALRRMGIEIGPNVTNLTVRNCSATERVEPLFCFCMSRRLNPTLAAERPQAVLEIKGVRALAGLLAEQNRKLLGSFMIAKVDYQPRVVSMFHETAEASPFVKDTKFEDEDELRIIWRPQSLPITAFLSAPNPKLAGLLVRVA